ncbi:hypothetical protein CPB83DRAFT_897645 [Crepidotus variabilis]|uniref:Uncharacterized protein n=1 Tax=Crepidotus variabilis TaxID=179855 RepID=A0A9P6JKX9_9AGAR|nr:hypothetical protein CPB83DRAFT_897645 [Crepidotus variabilis]
MPSAYNVTEDSGTELRTGVCWMVSCLTIIVFDMIIHIPEDVSLLCHHQIRLPTLAYAATRSSTLATLILTLIFDADKADSISIAKFNVQQSVHFAIRRAFFLTSVVQRGLTCLMFYIRVRALYRSNYYVQISLALSLLGVMASCLIAAPLSGLVNGAFDMAVFSAILWKLGCRPVVFESQDSVGKPVVRFTFWSPFKRSRVYQISDRFLLDSLLAVLISIIVKIPQIIFVSSKQYDGWLTPAMYLDVVFGCLAASHVFRDMKLQALHGNDTFTLSIRQSKMEFAFSIITTSQT